MKKLICLLVALLSVVSLCACGGTYRGAYSKVEFAGEQVEKQAFDDALDQIEQLPAVEFGEKGIAYDFSFNMKTKMSGMEIEMKMSGTICMLSETQFNYDSKIKMTMKDEASGEAKVRGDMVFVNGIYYLDMTMVEEYEGEEHEEQTKVKGDILGVGDQFEEIASMSFSEILQQVASMKNAEYVCYLGENYVGFDLAVQEEEQNASLTVQFAGEYKENSSTVKNYEFYYEEVYEIEGESNSVIMKMYYEEAEVISINAPADADQYENLY